MRYDISPRPYGENGEKFKNCQPGNQHAYEFEQEYKYMLDMLLETGFYTESWLEEELEWAFDEGYGIGIGEMYRGMASNTTTGNDNDNGSHDIADDDDFDDRKDMHELGSIHSWNCWNLEHVGTD